MSNIFEREMTREELETELRESFETTHMIKKNLSMRLYKMAKETYDRDQMEKKIIETMYEPTRRKVKKVTIIDENNAIIETFEKLFGDEEKTWYRVYHNGRTNSTVTSNFDMALIILVCSKYDVNDAAPTLIGRMIGIKEED